MTDPLASDDDWAELARELDRDKPPPSPAHEPHPADMVERQIEAEAVEPHHGMDPRVEDATVAEGEPELAADEEFEGEGDDAAPGEPGGAEGDQTLPGRKRRRRRRRRKKGAEGEPTATEQLADAPEAEIAEVGAAATGEEEAFDSESDADLVPSAADDDTTSEVLRDLIATWNVPSWDEIVSGLYRPG